MPNINENPDYQLLMKYIKSITPGNMTKESAIELMTIGERIQGGGAISDREREIFESNVAATDSLNGGAISDREREIFEPNVAATDSLNGGAISDLEIEQMTPVEYAAAVQSGLITPDQLMMESSGSTTTPAESQLLEQEAYFKRLMEEQQALPRLAPDTPQMRPQARPELTRPQARPTAPMQSPRPQMRR